MQQVMLVKSSRESGGCGKVTMASVSLHVLHTDHLHHKVVKNVEYSNNGGFHD